MTNLKPQTAVALDVNNQQVAVAPQQQQQVAPVAAPMVQPLTQNVNPSNPFANIEKEETPSQRGYIPAGNHVLLINSVVSQSKRKAGAGEFFLAEMSIVTSDNPAAIVGTPANYYQDYSWDGCIGRIKVFLAAGAGVGDDQITQQFAMDCVSEGQPLAGRYIVCKGRESTNKKGEVRVFTDFYIYEG